MKPSAFFINTVRGNIVEEAALVEALQAGRIAGTGLDVFEHEPKVHPALLGMSNVVLMPHVGSATATTRLRMAVIDGGGQYARCAQWETASEPCQSRGNELRNRLIQDDCKSLSNDKGASREALRQLY
jgi:phosphoglycerate dehydrogenase-like enzyme